MTERAQTALDFAIGMSVFLLAVAFVMAFVPGMLQPFTADSGETTVAADRVADQLGRHALGTGGRPYVLDTRCATAFFDLGAAPPADCRFAGTTLGDRVGLDARVRLNVTLLGADADGDGDRDVLCDDGDGHLDERPEPPTCATALAAGPPVPTGTGSVAVGRRVVHVDGRDATLIVRVF